MSAAVNIKHRKLGMYLIFGSGSRPENGCASSLGTPPAVVPEKPFKPLEFWCIATHDRKTLVERITPYMVADLPREYLIQTLAAEYGWSCEMFLPGAAKTGDDSVSCWQRVVTEFWESPSQTIEKLLLLVQAWFYTLLRYTYRMRFSVRGKRCGSDPIVGDIYSCTKEQYTAGLTKREIHRLTGVPNKYGATFYRSCHRDVQHCSDWKSFCASILRFCKTIQFPTSSDSPEQILEELGGNLPSVILQRRWSHTATRLAETSNLAMGIAAHVTRLDERVTFEGSSNLKRVERMEQEIGVLRVQCGRLSLACETMVEPEDCVSLVSTKLQSHQRAWGRQLACLQNNICKSEANFNRSIAALAEQMRRDRMGGGGAYAPKHASSSLESLVACRWLLENLPAASDNQKGFGSEWRSFWTLQWSQCESIVKCGNHPLRTLKDDERYNRVGQNLYGTLSNMLHGYGHLRNVPLHPDVQTMVKTIGPIHFNKDEQIDIEAERRRWLTGRNKVASRKEML